MSAQNGHSSYKIILDGETVAQVGDDLSPASQQGYTGHVGDNTGLVYMQARYYDPVIGRFYSNDPIGFRGEHSFNRYAYANNNPYKYVDPNGESAVAAVGTLLTADAVTPEPSDVAIVPKAIGYAALFVGAYAIDAVFNDSADPVEGILDGATEGEKTKGRTKNFDKSGGMDQANSDFDDIADPDSVEAITDGNGGEGRRGRVNDGSGRKINVRPSSSDGRPTVEIQDGKNRTKIRYNEEKARI